MLIKKTYILIFILSLLSIGFVSYASETDGTIDATNHYSLLCENDSCSTTSRINFLTTNGRDVHVTDTALTGDVWSEKFGWINLDPTTAGVTNTQEGVLGGHAWGENAGWINFNPTNGGVTINSTGQFVGYAWAQNYGWIKFDCAVLNACVLTDWRPLSEREEEETGGGGSTGSYTGGGTGEVVTNEDIPVLDEPEADEPQKEEEEPTSNTNEPINEEETNSDNNEEEKENISLAITQPVIEDITREIKEVIINISNGFKTETGKAISTAIATTGAIFGAYVSVATVLFTTPISFSEIVFIPIKLWGLLLAAFGLKRKNQPWGTVYDSVTKQPLDPAYVVLQDLNGNEVATSITDLDGRYGFLVPPGQYRIVANKTNYEFPSKKLFGKTSDELYHDLYFNEIIEIKEGDVITKNIPLDPVKFDWNEFAKKDQNLMKFFKRRDLLVARISNILFILGFIFSLIALIVSPVIYNFIILGIYIILLLLKRTVLKPRAYGDIKQKINNNPLSFAIMRVFFSQSGEEVIHKVADKTGKYYCLIPNGTYFTKIESKNADESYTLVHTSDPIEVTRGYINKKFEV